MRPIGRLPRLCREEFTDIETMITWKMNLREPCTVEPPDEGIP